ncbi:hypothetical protein DCAR_0831237 [Daucus carota subsp. sativus]|uniref:COBRA C-terminal domain-containing protein n=1 Tax=Daucus carota subsp. sativus TaxID=79200 RepID=A0AAF0XSA2_DAUCS|nr:hypothetical protein DCAR_0831237 [Daucus carota subsp. sativus]
MNIRFVTSLILFLLLFSCEILFSRAQDPTTGGGEKPIAPPPQAASCNGIFISYQFVSRKKEYPHLKNATAQPWAFKSTATVLNTGTTEMKEWKLFIKFQHKEILVSASGASVEDADDMPADVSNGTTLTGSGQSVLKTSIDTAGDLTQIQAEMKLVGTQFGVRPPGVPMPKTIKLQNDGYKCPAPNRRAKIMYACCVKDPKFKVKKEKTKFYARRKGDLVISYDVTQATKNNYQAQVTMENNHPLGRLDHWNLTWEWMRGEFIYNMKGAYTHLKDYADCLLGPAATYYSDLDFSQVQNCQKNPVMADLPPERAKDKIIGNIPFCCKNGSLMSPIMNKTNAKAVFQLQVFKLPPDLNVSSITPPSKWKIEGIVSTNFKCGNPLRVAQAQFPDPGGLDEVSLAVASWQVVCNITRPKKGKTKCCVSYSGYYNESIIPCDTCACGCDDDSTCRKNAAPILIPPEALLIPFVNRTAKALAWSKLRHKRVRKPLPCGDNCGVSINWHVSTNYKSGWSVRVTLFNWKENNFQDWFVAAQLKKAGRGFEKAYSFNGTLLRNLNNTIFLEGLPGLTYLMAITNGTNPRKDYLVPGKQQSVLSFNKKNLRNLKIEKGDGFPSKLFFNGEECSLPKIYPIPDFGHKTYANSVLVLLSLAFTVLFFL